MAGYNLATYKDRLLYLVEGHIGLDSSPAHPDPLLFQKMMEAERELLRLAGRRVAETATGEINVVSGTALYDLPGPRLREVYYKQPTGLWKRLVRRDLKALQDLFGFAGTDVPDSPGEPAYWSVDDVARKILLLPVPDVSQSLGLSLTYDAGPTPLERLLNDSGVTASTGAESARVTLSASIAGRYAVGDEFGIVATLQTDGTAIPNPLSPHVWYAITDKEEVAATQNAAAYTTLTVAHTFTAAASGLRFVVAQVPDVEHDMPGEWGMAIPDYAAGLLFDLMGPDDSATAIAAKWKAQAAETVENARQPNRGTGAQTTGPGRSLPYLFRRG
jgi:hypothetical protein